MPLEKETGSSLEEINFTRMPKKNEEIFTEQELQDAKLLQAQTLREISKKPFDERLAEAEKADLAAAEKLIARIKVEPQIEAPMTERQKEDLLKDIGARPPDSVYDKDEEEIHERSESETRIININEVGRNGQA